MDARFDDGTVDNRDVRRGRVSKSYEVSVGAVCDRAMMRPSDKKRGL